jgi:hypothetical protein
METTSNPADARQGQRHDQGATAAPGEWHYAPDLPIGNNPLFVWPWDWRRIVS